MDAMVTAMPGYRAFDSLLRLYQNRFINCWIPVLFKWIPAFGQYFKSWFRCCKSRHKVKDYAGLYEPTKAADGSLSNQLQQYAQGKLEDKKAKLAQSLYVQVQASYVKIRKPKNTSLCLNPALIEFGPPIDNLFISVAKDLKTYIVAAGIVGVRCWPWCTTGYGQPGKWCC